MRAGSVFPSEELSLPSEQHHFSARRLPPALDSGIPVISVSLNKHISQFHIEKCFLACELLDRWAEHNECHLVSVVAHHLAHMKGRSRLRLPVVAE